MAFQGKRLPTNGEAFFSFIIMPTRSSMTAMRPLSRLAGKPLPAVWQAGFPPRRGQRVAKPTPLFSDLVHFQTDLRIIRWTISPHRLRINTHCPAAHACMCERGSKRRPGVASVSSGLSQQILQHDIVQHHIRHQTLQLSVLVLKLLQALGIVCRTNGVPMAIIG